MNTKKSKGIPVFTKQEIDIIASKVSENPLADSILIMLYTGIRIDELLNIKSSDIDLSSRIIKIHSKKSSRTRNVPIHKAIIPYIEKRLSNEFLYEIDGEKIESTQYQQNFFVPFMSSLNINHSVHIARHTFSKTMSTYTSAEVVNAICDYSNKDVPTATLISEIDKLTYI